MLEKKLDNNAINPLLTICQTVDGKEYTKEAIII